MTIVVSVRVNGGIVLASDSAASFSRADGTIVKVYNNENKIFNLLRGKPVGAMTYGWGDIGKASISTLSKDLRIRLCEAGSPYAIDVNSYTIEGVAKKASQFFLDAFGAAYPDGKAGFSMGYRISGYSTGRALPESWGITLSNGTCSEPEPLYDTDDSYGPRWAGTTEALDRLILGVDPNFTQVLTDIGIEATAASNLHTEVVKKCYATLFMAAMPMQDAVNLAKFLAGTAARFSEFRLQAPTVGGPIEIATITKHEGFKWVARKHFYSHEFNRLENDHVTELPPLNE